MTSLRKGTVLWFNNAFGYGFIDGGPLGEVFVHYSEIVSENQFKTLKRGELVKFEPAKNDKGESRAKKVIRII